MILYNKSCCRACCSISPCFGSASSAVLARPAKCFGRLSWGRITIVASTLMLENEADLYAATHDLLEYVAVTEAATPIFAEDAVVQHDVPRTKAAKPAMGQVELQPGAELPLRADATEVADRQHAYHQLRIDRGASDQAGGAP